MYFQVDLFRNRFIFKDGESGDIENFILNGIIFNSSLFLVFYLDCLLYCIVFGYYFYDGG